MPPPRAPRIRKREPHGNQDPKSDMMSPRWLLPQTHNAQVVFLKLFLPGRNERTAGVLLLDQVTGQLHVRIREDWDRIADPEDADVLSCLAADFRQKIDELGDGGGREFLRQMQDQFSNV